MGESRERDSRVTLRKGIFVVKCVWEAIRCHLTQVQGHAVIEDGALGVCLTIPAHSPDLYDAPLFFLISSIIRIRVISTALSA